MVIYNIVLRNLDKYYFRKLVNVYDVNVLRKKKDEEINKYLSKLYYSPLCIKWFVINVGKGNNPDIIVNSQEELVEFCLSNVFDKLSDMAKYIIQILLVKQTSCSIAELVYINNSNYTLYRVDIRSKEDILKYLMRIK